MIILRFRSWEVEKKYFICFVYHFYNLPFTLHNSMVVITIWLSMTKYPYLKWLTRHLPNLTIYQ